MSDPCWLDRVRGYLELSMLDAAWEELNQLSDAQLNRPETYEMRISILLDQGRLEEALAYCGMLTSLDPENHAGYIQGAFCLHALDRTEDAIALIQTGPGTLLEEPVYFYNLACYEQARGKSQAALTWLRTSIEMSPHFRKRALEDPDLVEIREEI